MKLARVGASGCLRQPSRAWPGAVTCTGAARTGVTGQPATAVTGPLRAADERAEHGSRPPVHQGVGPDAVSRASAKPLTGSSVEEEIPAPSLPWGQVRGSPCFRPAVGQD